MNALAGLEDFLRATAERCAEFAETRAQAKALEELADTLKLPFTVAIVGRMKSGKSSLINALVGSPLAITDVEESTATINVIGYGSSDQAAQAIVHWRDGRNEVVPRERITEWAGKTPDVIERCRRTEWIEFFAKVPHLRDFQIVDTPGTGSVVTEHETATREFLNPQAISASLSEAGKADAIIYVVTPAVRQDAAKTLEEFAQTRLPGTGPYNSVCVLHKWDELNEADPANNAAHKAAALRERLHTVVSEVFPVSAPLALAAKYAPRAFFTGLLEAAAPVEEHTRARILSMSNRWDEDPVRKACRATYPMPWMSFRLLVSQIWSQHPADPLALAELCRNLGRVEPLENFLRDRFFARAAIIKQSLALRKAGELVDRIIHRLRDHAQALQASGDLAQEVCAAARGLNPHQQQWLVKTRDDLRAETGRTREALSVVSEQWNQQKWKLEGLTADLRVCDFAAEHPERFPDGEREGILALCNALATKQGRDHVPAQWAVSDLIRLIDKYRILANSARRSEESLFQHIVDRLTQAASLFPSGA
jgi:GTPase SAR1 family protein